MGRLQWELSSVRRGASLPFGEYAEGTLCLCPLARSSAALLEADGLGGFASGTVSGIRTRRYHALLLAATTPPTGRMVLVNGIEAWLETWSIPTA